MIRCKEKETYAQVLKVVQNYGSLRKFKDKVAGVRRTAAGEVRLRLTKSSQALGDQAVVKTMADKATLEITDIAEWTNSADVLEVVFRAIDSDLSVEAAPKLRPAYQGTRRYRLSCPRISLTRS